MKTINLIRFLLGSLLAFQVCSKCAAQLESVTTASDFSVIGDQANHIVSKSPEDDFTASGSASDPIDHSSVSGAQSISRQGLTFSGLGRFSVASGIITVGGLPTPSLSAAGDTSVYILFVAKDTLHYQWRSSVTTNGNVKGYVVLNAVTNGGGMMTANGTIKAKDINVLQAFMREGTSPSSGKGFWSYSLSLTPATIKSGRFSAVQKESLYAEMTALRTLSDQLDNFAYKSTRGALRQELLAASQAIFVLAGNLAQDALDPLDTNYMVLAQALAPAVTPLAAGTNITQRAADVYNAWLTNLSLSAGYSTALSTSVNRAQGAAYAGDSYWDQAQMNAAVQFEAQLAGLLDQEPALRSNVVAQFESDGFPAIAVTTNDVNDLQSEISTNGLPLALMDGLTALGADPETITNIQNLLLTADVDTMAGSFPESLVNTNLDSSGHALAAGLRDASLVLINAALLPGGQFRFDLPTEPGYTYSIQFTQNPANPAGWTTLFNNQATTALLSFTNTPPSSTQAGSYRASHN